MTYRNPPHDLRKLDRYEIGFLILTVTYNLQKDILKN